MNDTIIESKRSVGCSPDEPKSQSQTVPVWIRLPREGRRCPFTGLTRASLNKLILGDDPKVDSTSVMDEGATRGVRLIRLRSLLDYLDRLQREQEEKGGE